MSCYGRAQLNLVRHDFSTAFEAGLNRFYSKARRFYSSKGYPLKVKGLNMHLFAKSKGKQAVTDLVVSRCSSHPTLDYFDTLKKTKMKSLKDLKAVCKVRKKDLVLPLRMDRDVFARMALLGQSD